MKRVTIKDIASAANVHPSVVSAVVNGNNKVIHCSEKTNKGTVRL
ncbi:MAG: LacI family DNA-binding transcriptional regulator [Lentisphaeria bacterium]|nr:LacI family DNA-binding transcriptional regulator [Lentisphaeria bacterium]